jgi:hypothetical protein
MIVLFYLEFKLFDTSEVSTTACTEQFGISRNEYHYLERHTWDCKARHIIGENMEKWFKEHFPLKEPPEP